MWVSSRPVGLPILRAVTTAKPRTARASQLCITGLVRRAPKVLQHQLRSVAVDTTPRIITTRIAEIHSTKQAIEKERMASTTPSSGPSATTIVAGIASLLAVSGIGYAFYFDYRRRSDPEFRKYLKRQHKKVAKEVNESSKAAEEEQKLKIRAVVDEANEEGFPRDPEETEAYFMQEVARGEGMCQDGSDPVEAALCFYKALKVYPQPRELISIYDKTVPKVSSQ